MFALLVTIARSQLFLKFFPRLLVSLASLAEQFFPNCTQMRAITYTNSPSPRALASKRIVRPRSCIAIKLKRPNVTGGEV